MIKGISISIIIDDIKNKQDVVVVKDTLLHALSGETIHQSTTVYTKFPDAYKLEFMLPFINEPDKEKVIYQMLLLSDAIARPWLVYVDKDGDNTELIFNRDDNTQTIQNIFSHIRWAHIQLIY